jgi:hypothetical protein
LALLGVRRDLESVIDAGCTEASTDRLAVSRSSGATIDGRSTLSRKDIMTPSQSHGPPTIASANTRDIAELATVPFNQESWDRWQARGRADDAASARRLRMAGLFAATIAFLAASFWASA